MNVAEGSVSREIGEVVRPPSLHVGTAEVCPNDYTIVDSRDMEIAKLTRQLQEQEMRITSLLSEKNELQKKCEDQNKRIERVRPVQTKGDSHSHAI
jgi:hypothetical protein